MFGKKPVTPAVENAVAKAVNYEVTVADIAKRSEKRAWMVAFGSLVMSLILAGGYFYFLPLKEKVPYLVMADAYTGTATVARLRDDFSNPSVSTSEALNKSNISHFIMARESYDFSQIGERDWATVFAMGSPQVATSYQQLFGSSNPANPITIYGKTKTIRVKLLSIQLAADAMNTDGAPKVATVRFQRSLYNKESGDNTPLDSKIATIEFTYKSNLKMDELNRVLNPLGFQVTGYRVDNDYAAAPALPANATPGQVQAPAPAAAYPPGTVAPGQVSPDAAAPAGYPPGTAPPPAAYPPGTAPPPGAAPAGYPPGTAPAGAPLPTNPAQPQPPAGTPAPTGNANGVSNR